MHTFAKRNALNAVSAGFAILACAGVAALAITALAGTKTGVALALISIGGPVLGYVAIVAPLVFPFGLYVLLVPFDNILNVGAFGTLTKLLAIVAGAAIIFYLVRTKRAVAPPRSLLLWCAFLAWATLTAFWAIDQGAVFRMLPTAIELLILYAAISVLPAERSNFRYVALATIGGGILAAAYGAYLFHHGIDLYYGGRLRITTDTGAIDPNHFAAALLLPIALCIGNFLTARRWVVASANLAALGILFVGLTLSQSRGGIMAMSAILLYFLVRSARRIRLLVLLGATVVMGLVFSAQTSLWTRFGEALSTGGAGRTSIWRVGLEAFKSHWFIGAGYNNFPYAYDEAYLRTPHQMWGSFSDWHRAPHNVLIGTSVELGIIGLCLLLIAWIGQFRMLRHIPPSDPDYTPRIALEATVIGTFIAALFLDVLTFKYLWLTFMLMAILRNAHYFRRPLDA